MFGGLGDLAKMMQQAKEIKKLEATCAKQAAEISEFNSSVFGKAKKLLK